MIAVYSKHRDRIIITKQINFYKFDVDTKEVIIFYTKYGKDRYKMFDRDKAITIKHKNDIYEFKRGR